MKLSILTKSFLSQTLLYLGLVSRKLDRNSRSGFLLLMYHRVIPAETAKNGVQAGMYVQPETLRMHLRFLKAQSEIVPLSDLRPMAGRRSFSESSKSLCAITFDDGWYDFYENTYPVLKEEGVPATVFLPTGYIGTKEWFWTDRLAHLLLQRRNNQNLTGEGAPAGDEMAGRLLAIKGGFESRLEKGIALLKELKSDVIEGVIGDLAGKTGVKPEERGRAFLSWDEVREMGGSGLVTFGSHTVNHSILTTLTEQEVGRELAESRERLLNEGVVGSEFIPFCYPNGNYTARIAEMVREAGYSMAVTTKKGWNGIGYDPYALRRIGIHQDISSTKALFGCRVTGIF